MMRWRCSRESDTARAASAGEWPDGVRAHAAGCPICRDVALVAGALRRDPRHLPADLPPAAAGRIWWMARIRARRAAAQRALRPITVMELAAMAAMALVAAGALASVLPAAASWLAELRLVPAVTGVGGQVAVSGVTVAASAGLAILLLALARLLTRAG